MPRLLITYDSGTDYAWGEAFRPRLRAGLGPLSDIQEVDLTEHRGEPISQHVDLGEVDIVLQYSGRLTAKCIAGAPNLQAVGNVGDNRGYGVDYAALMDRGIPIIDTTRGWAQSVAEVGLSLILNCLRRSAWWHRQVANGQGEEPWADGQFSDNPNFVNGELMGKRLGIVGLGQIGSRLAKLASIFPTETLAYDPYVPDAALAAVNARRADLDELLETSQIVAVCVPPNPNSIGMIDERRIDLIGQGSIVILITRAAAVAMPALRRRVIKDELFLGADVFDVEPLPPDDPLRARDNVVHYPHIAGRTQNARNRMADLMIEDVRRVLNGQRPQYALSPEKLRLNNERLGTRT